MNRRTKAPGPRWMRSIAAGAVVMACLAPTAPAKPEKEVAPDPSRTTAVHHIPVFDREGAQLQADSKAPMSQKVTCGKCHDYEVIRHGWHFNTGDANVPKGRPGQPWVLADKATGTQIPISPRGWKGTYTPAQIGMTSWKYVDTFGRQLPGGDYGDRFSEKVLDPFVDGWDATGKLSINCLACHSRDFRVNMDEWAKNIERGNWLEAESASAAMGHALGYVKKLPEMFDRMMPEAPDSPQFLPSIVYDESRFGYKNAVHFDVTASKIDNNRCYYCHSVHPVAKQEYEVQQDVHMARGMNCVTCHRNGIDHRVSRNYEGEAGATKGYSCRACHMGESDAMTHELRKGGFGAAPRPEHKGIPAIHFEEMTCTACHSGLMPADEPHRVQTARIHALGVHSIAYDPNMLPTVLEPVFVKQDDGKIAPCRMVFPAFFARRLQDGRLRPMLPDAVLFAAQDVLKAEPDKPVAAPTKEKIVAALKMLAGDPQDANEPVYVGGGKLWQIDGNAIAARDDAAARPYAWPLAHDVRPAAQALGAGGQCTACHATDSAMLFGKVRASAPVPLGEPVEMEMTEFTGEDGLFHSLFATTFVFRPYLKIFGFSVSILVTLILLACGLPELAAGFKGLARRFTK